MSSFTDIAQFYFISSLEILHDGIRGSSNDARCTCIVCRALVTPDLGQVAFLCRMSNFPSCTKLLS